MTDETVSLTLRLPKALHEALRKQAELEHRSLNGQVLHALSASVPSLKAAKR